MSTENSTPIINDDFFASQDIANETDFLNPFLEENKSNDSALNSQENKLSNPVDGPAVDNFKFDETLEEAEKNELKELNERLNTKFETLDELKTALGTSKPAVNPDEQLFNQNEAIISDLTRYIGMSSRDLMSSKLYADAQANNKDINNPEVIEEINLDLERWLDNDTLDLRANALKAELNVTLKEKKAFNDNYQNTVKKNKEEQIVQKKQLLADVVSKAFKNSNNQFYGTKVEKQDFIDAYQVISNKKLSNHIENNPDVALEVALFLKNRVAIAKRAGGPTYSDGLKDTFAELAGKRPLKNQNTNADDKSSALSNSGNSSLVADFIK